MHELAFSAALRLEPNSGAARLEGFAIRAGGDFHKFICRRKPNFKIIGLRRSESRVPSAEQHGSVMQSQFLQNRFRIPHKRFEFVVALLGMSKFEHLDLLKLM